MPEYERVSPYLAFCVLTDGLGLAASSRIPPPPLPPASLLCKLDSLALCVEESLAGC